MPAYVIVWMDYEKRPPQAVNATICSEEHPSSTMSLIPQCVLQVGEDSEEYADCLDRAVDEVSLLARSHPQFVWITEELEKQPWYRG